MNRQKNNYESLYKLLIRVLKKVDAWKEYEEVLCDAFNSICALEKRLATVRIGSSTTDEAEAQYAVGVLAAFPGSSQVLAQQIAKDIESNWRVVSQQLLSMNALVIQEVHQMAEDAKKSLPTIPVGAVASQGSGIPILAGECALWIGQIDKMLYGEYLRKRELFAQYTTNQIENVMEASSVWPASSCEGMIDYSLLNTISNRISLNNK